MRFLIQRAADVNARTKEGKTALMLAASEDEETSSGDPEGVEILLSAGAKPNIADRSGSTPLMSAARYGGSDIVRTLLEHGADASLANNKGQTALAIALASSHREVAEILRRAGARE